MATYSLYVARTARLIIPGAAYHVTARGNYRQRIFFDRADQELYLTLLGTKSEFLGLEVLGWCLMPNHVHLLVRERQDASLANTVRSVHSAYATQLNRRLGNPSGHLWQGRFYSYPIPRNRLWMVLRYIELNPVRAGVAATANDYAWSTARYHLGTETPPALLSLLDWQDLWTHAQWKEALHSGINGEDEIAIARATKLGCWKDLSDRTGPWSTVEKYA